VESALFLQGVFIGIAIAAPVGPIGLLCFQRTLTKGWLHGLLSGLGAATADAVYAVVAALGLSAAVVWLTGSSNWLQFSGGIFLCWLGLSTIRSRATDPAAASAGSPIKDYATTFMLTLANPATVLAFIAIFAGAGAIDPETNRPLALVFGVFLGSALWWLALTTIAASLKHRFNAAHIRWLNILSGTAILGFGLWVVASPLLP
jgi:threonine/homoserine/homoserine lactone efflux protein